MLRNTLFYVKIGHLSDAELSFLGYSLIKDAETKLYQRYDGEEYLVDKANPILAVNDMNDAMIMKASDGFTFRKVSKDQAEPPPNASSSEGPETNS